MSRHSDLLYLRDMAEHARRAMRIADSLQTYERFVEEDFCTRRRSSGSYRWSVKRRST